jgi:small Trp-rich protein
MWLVWLGVAMLGLRFLGVLGLDRISAWWIALPFMIAFFWFEIVERRLGFNRRKAFDEMEEQKKKRIKEALERDETGARLRRRL